VIRLLRALLLIFLIPLAPAARASRPRPVSDLRFDVRPVGGVPAATNGADFLLQGTLRQELVLPVLGNMWWAGVSTSGPNTAVFLAVEEPAGDSRKRVVLWNLLLAADGSIVRPVHRIGSVDDYAVPLTAVWNGSEYVLLLTLYGPRPAVLHVSAAGDARGDVVRLEPGGTAQGLASNGRESIAVSEYGRAAMIPASNPSAYRAVEVWQAPVEQSGITIAAAARGSLAAWYEYSNRDGAILIRASRVDAAGNYLDGDGIVVARLTLPFIPHLAVAGDGEEWMVAWSALSRLQAARISADGTLLDSPPLDLGAGRNPDLRWDGKKYLMVYLGGTSGNEVDGRTLTRSGTPAPPSILFLTPSVPAAGGGILDTF
jgi:hypothetical protein